MKTRRTSHPAFFGLRRTLSVYHLVGAALPLVSSGCSSDDRSSSTSQSLPSFPGPTSSTPAEVPPTPGATDTTETGTPAATPTEGQQGGDLVVPEGPEIPAAGNGDPLDGEPSAPSNCVGQAWPTADPTSPGPFQVTAEKNVGPLAGFLPDPVYGDVQQRFNVYRPSNLDSSGFCHPVLVWANGRGDNPEQHPPECIVNPATNTWCGTYPGLINQLVSHGFVVIASLSTTTSRGEPLPTIAGLNWLLEQAEDSTSPYFHHIDTARIGALGHSEGGASTSIAAADPRISAIATVCGSRALTALHRAMPILYHLESVTTDQNSSFL